MQKIVIKALLILISFSIVKAQNPGTVDIGDPIYPFLERMESKGLVTHLLDGAKPFSRGFIAKKLKEVEKQFELLSAIERIQLQNFLMDYRFELKQFEKHALIPSNKNWYSTLSSLQNVEKDFFRMLSRHDVEEENHTVMWEDSTSNFYLDLQQYLTVDFHSGGNSRNANEQSYIFKSVLENNLSLQTKISLQAVRGDVGFRELDPLVKGTFNQQNEAGSKLFLDRTGGEIAYNSGYFNFYFAQKSIQWGHGSSGNLILSDYAEQYPYIAFTKNWGWGRFTVLHGKLYAAPSDTIEISTEIYPDRWVAAHRLEIAPFSNFTFSLNEVFIYGHRYADWAYLLPFNFYRAAQHKLRDRDNATISLDAEYIPFPTIKLYGTLFIDEMKFEELGTDWWGNKHAMQLGLHWVDPFTLSDSDLRAEYTAIMPWVYTHYSKVNRYISDGRSLGHWAGPNSELIYFEANKWFTPRLRFGVKAERLKKGYNSDNENIGGDILLGHTTLIGSQNTPRQTRRFLEGKLLDKKSLQVNLQYELFNELYISGSATWYNEIIEQTKKSYNILHLGMVFNY